MQLCGPRLFCVARFPAANPISLFVIGLFRFSISSLVSFGSLCVCYRGFPGVSDDKEYACNVGHPGSISRSERFPGERKGFPIQYSSLENLMDRGAWWGTIHGISKSRT